MNQSALPSPGVGMASPRDPRLQARSYLEQHMSRPASQPVYPRQSFTVIRPAKTYSQHNSPMTSPTKTTEMRKPSTPNRDNPIDSGDDVVFCGEVPASPGSRREQSLNTPPIKNSVSDDKNITPNSMTSDSSPASNNPPRYGVKRKTRPKKNQLIGSSQSQSSTESHSQSLPTTSLKPAVVDSSAAHVVLGNVAIDRQKQIEKQATTDYRVPHSTKPIILRAPSSATTASRVAVAAALESQSKSVIVSPISSLTSNSATNAASVASTSSQRAPSSATSNAAISAAAQTTASLQAADPRLAQPQATSLPIQKIATPSKDITTAALNAASTTVPSAIKQVKFDDAKHELKFAKTEPATSISQSQQPIASKPQQASLNISSILKTPTTASSARAQTPNSIQQTVSSGPTSRRAKSELWSTTKSTGPSANNTSNNINDNRTEMVNSGQHLSHKSRAAYPAHGFDWDTYLELVPAEVAPREAFKQTTKQIANLFEPGMKLEACDPRNRGSWGLASVVRQVGLRLRIRFDGCDALNDFYELIDSENIRVVGSVPGEPLFPPVGHKGAHHSYNRYVEKMLLKPNTKVAPSHFFIPPPSKPDKNLFKIGMKLEAIDRKHPDLICPATIGEVNGDEIKIMFDGWKGSFDYSCLYDSRDIFPINWCRDNNHLIAAPNGWDALLNSNSAQHKTMVNTNTSVSNTSKNTLTKNLGQNNKNKSVLLDSKDQLSEKEIHMAKVQLQPKSSNASPKPSNSKHSGVSLSFKAGTPIKMSQSTPKKESNKRKRSPTSDSTISIENNDQEYYADDDFIGNVIEGDDIIDKEAACLNKFQCQRTIPYCVWVKAKSASQAQQKRQPESQIHIEQLEKAVPESASCVIMSNSSSPSTIGPEVNTSDSSSTLIIPELSPVRSQCATGAIAEEQDLKGRPRRGRPPKKFKFDHLPLHPNHTEPNNQKESFPANHLEWTIDHIGKLIRSDRSLAKYSDIFSNHEIDGKAFVLLTTDVMVSHMGLKIGPVLKIMSLIDQVKLKKLDLSTLSENIL